MEVGARCSSHCILLFERPVQVAQLWLSVYLFTALYYCTASAQQDCLDLFVPPIFTSISIGHFTPE